MGDDQTTLRVNSIDLSGSVADGPGVRLVVFFQGCDKKVKCVNCHNPSSHSMRGGTAMTVADIVKRLEESPIRRVTLSGGEPLAQSEEGLFRLVQTLKADGFEIALYTWRQIDQVPARILQRIDWLKVGEYREELRTSTSAYVGSSNQRFFKVA
ncbi:MAG: radical SAM protein [Kiritimatiellae bacterium]|nr:radical SAM protein [Kiritimatiellia bacterium]